MSQSTNMIKRIMMAWPSMQFHHLFIYLTILAVLPCRPLAFLKTLSNNSISNSSTEGREPYSVRVMGPWALSTDFSKSALSLFWISLDNVSWATGLTYPFGFPEALVPMYGSSELALCNVSNIDFTSSPPCGVFGFFTTGRGKHWLSLSLPSPLEAEPINYAENTSFPFHCSKELPCSIRTSDPLEGEQAGCYMNDPSVDTLVVVTWNRHRYIFRPLRYVIGTGNMSIVPINDWPLNLLADIPYDPTMQFGDVGLENGYLCILKIIHLNGTIDMYIPDQDDPKSSLGIAWYGTVTPPSSAATQMCLPSVTMVAISTAYIIYGSLLVVTCQTGEGWMWVVDETMSLYGHFILPPPPSAKVGQPLMADVTVVQVLLSFCTGLNYGFVTSVALLGTGFMQPMPRIPIDGEDTRMLTMAVFLSSMYSFDDNHTTFWLTETLFSNCTVGAFQILDGVQPLRNGLGWIMPDHFPATVVGNSNGGCQSLMNETLRWVASMTLYSGVTSDYFVLINASTGELADSASVTVGDQSKLYGGVSLSGPIRINSASATKCFVRAPTCLYTANVVLQLSAGSVTTNLLALTFPLMGPSAENNNSIIDWYWVPEGPNPSTTYYPSPISLSHNFPIFPPTSSFVWFSASPMVFAKDLQSQTVSVAVAASTQSMVESVSASFFIPVVPSLPVAAQSPVNSDASPMLFVCHGHIVSSYNSNIGIKVWSTDILKVVTEDGTLACASGNCTCTADDQIFVPNARAYATVPFFDYVLFSRGVVVLNFENGTPISFLSTMSLSTSLVEGVCAGTDLFGPMVDLSNGLGTQGFAFTAVGTQCVILAAFAPGNEVFWGIFTLLDYTGTFPGFQATIFTARQSLILLQTPTISNPQIEAYVFDVTIMWWLLQSNPTGMLFSLSPTHTIPQSQSIIVLNEIIFSLSVLVLSTNTLRLPMIQIFAYDAVQLTSLWYTGYFEISNRCGPECIDKIALFPAYQTETTGAVVWACVAAFNVFCVVASRERLPTITFNWTFDCYGVPVASINRFLIFAQQGTSPQSVPLNTHSIGWIGIQSLIPAAYQVQVNDTTCVDPLVSNDVLLLQCAMQGSTEMRLILVNAQTGILLYSNGPKVVPNSYSVSIDGTMLTYTEAETGTITTITLQTEMKNIEIPISTTVCASDGAASYVLSLTDTLFTATRTFFDPHMVSIALNSSSTFYTKTNVAFRELGSASLDRMIQILDDQDLVSQLQDALPPSVLQTIDSDPFSLYLTLLTPNVLTDANGEIMYMSASSCGDCTSDCPQFCVLNILTGDQIKFTSTMRNMTGILKPYGGYLFSYANVSYPVHYSGNVSLNIVRFLTQQAATYQNITCYGGTNSIIALSGRYCLLTAGSVWSVISFSAEGRAMAATYQLGARSDLRGSRTQPSGIYYGYLVWSADAIFESTSPDDKLPSDIGIQAFLSNSLQALPSKVPASNRAITSVSSVTLKGSILSVLTDAGVLMYSSATCNDPNKIPNTLPLCSTTLEPFVPNMADSNYVTVAWTGVRGSNWGAGFVATGYQVKLSSILRDVSGGAPVDCTLIGNTKPQCSSICQPTTDAGSQQMALILSYVWMKSWLPAGSSYAVGDSNSSLVDDYGFRFYVSSTKHVIVTVEIDGIEFVSFISSSITTQIFGASFGVSHCVFFNLPNLVAQPFSWMAFNAVKSLVLTLAFFYVEHHIRGRERRKEALRDKVKRQQAIVVSARKKWADEGRNALHSTEALSQSSMEKSINNCPTETAMDFQREGLNLHLKCTAQLPQKGVDLLTLEEIEQLEADIVVCEAEGRRYRSWIPLPNLVDGFVSSLASFGAFHHPLDRESFARRVRSNVLMKELDEENLVELLFFILKEKRDNIDTVTAFAFFYEWNLCNNKSWVVRQQPPYLEESEKLSITMAEDLEKVQNTLREVYNAFKVSQMDTLSRSYLKAIDSNITTTSDSQSMKSRRHVSETASVKSDDFTPLIDSLQVTSSTDRRSLSVSTKKSNEFLDLVDAFNALHITQPGCFEYAILSSRRTDTQLQPSAILISLSLAQSVATVLLYAVDVYTRSKATPISALQMYECVYFMIFNSSLPSSLLVNAIFHADLSPTVEATSLRSWAWSILSSPFVFMSLFLLGPALVTHVLPGLFLYAWALVPLLSLAICAEYFLRRTARRQSKTLVSARICTRIAILLATSIAFSIAYNVADAYIWQWLPGEQAFETGSYIKQSYFKSLSQDYNSRSLSCALEHLFDSISNFVQMGFFLV